MRETALDNSDHLLNEQHISHAYGVFTLDKKHRRIKKLRKKKDEPEIHGDKVWGSTYLIMDYLEDNPLAPGLNIMDLGCGWGALSIYCAAKQKGKVTAVDADKRVFPYLKEQEKLNGVKLKSKVKRFEELSSKLLGKQDVIVGSDICFWDELVPALYSTIKKAHKAGVGKIIIADPGRSTFLKLAKKCGKKFGAELIDYELEDPAADGYVLVIDNTK